MAKGYLDINYSSASKSLASSSYIYQMRLDNFSDRGDLVASGSLNTPSIFKNNLDYYQSLETYSRKNAVYSINYIAMIPRDFIEVVKNKEELHNLYDKIARDLTKRLADMYEYTHIANYAVHSVISKTDGKEQPHIHIQISSRGYKEEVLTREDITPKELIASGKQEKYLQKINTFYDSREVFVKVMNKYLEEYNIKNRYSSKSNYRLLDSSNIGEVLEGLMGVDDKIYHNLDLSEYDTEELKQLDVAIKKSIVLEDKIKKAGIESIDGDNYLLSLIDKRNQLYKKILSFNDNLYTINNIKHYKSYILVRKILDGLNINDYLKTNKIIIDVENDNSKYFKIGNMTTCIDNIKKDKSLLNIYNSYDNIYTLYTNMEMLNKTGTALDRKNHEILIKDKSYVDINDSFLKIVVDSKAIDNKYLTMMNYLTGYDILIQKSINNRSNENTIKKIYNGEPLDKINTLNGESLTNYINNNVRILNFGYMDALNLLKDIYKEIQRLQGDKSNIERIKELGMQYKDIKKELSNKEIQERVSMLKNNYEELKYNSVKLNKDLERQNKVVNIVTEYKTGFNMIDDNNTKIGKLFDKYDNVKSTMTIENIM